jgi:SAM-dependent methyltransferase
VKALDRVLQRWRVSQAVAFVREGDRLLDVGCFDRCLIDRVRDRVQAAVGIDPLVVPTHDDRVELIRGRFPNDLERPAESFDCIAILAVFEHVEDPSAVAMECRRLLTEGGRVVLTVPHALVDRILDVLLFLGLADGMSADEHHGFDVARTVPIFEEAGLELEHQASFQLGLNQLYVFKKP